MGSGTTPVQGWPFPELTDAPTVSADLQALATALDAVAKRLSGLASARPAAALTPVDTIYFATDSGVYSICTGAAWETMLVAGSDQTLTLASGWGVPLPFYTPVARLEGDTVRLSGTMKNNTGGSVGPVTTIATLPQTYLYPSVSRQVTANVVGQGAAQVAIGSGPIQLDVATVLASGLLALDGITYRI